MKTDEKEAGSHGGIQSHDKEREFMSTFIALVRRELSFTELDKRWRKGVSKEFNVRE